MVLRGLYYKQFTKTENLHALLEIWYSHNFTLRYTLDNTIQLKPLYKVLSILILKFTLWGSNTYSLDRKLPNYLESHNKISIIDYVKLPIQIPIYIVKKNGIIRKFYHLDANFYRWFSLFYDKNPNKCSIIRKRYVALAIYHEFPNSLVILYKYQEYQYYYWSASLNEKRLFCMKKIQNAEK